MNATTRTQPANLSNWVERISQEEMPVFSHTIQKMVRFTENSEGSLSELAKLVLQDVGMTARVLRMANSSYYNPLRYSISTISRAVVLLGLNVVRSICLSAVLIDTLIKRGVRERVAQEIARSFHAAVQARALAVQRSDTSPETVFIAALLQNIGEMAFWCMSGETGERLDRALRRPGCDPAQVEEEILGFRLKELSQGLSQAWGLEEVLHAPAQEGAKAKQRGEWITLGYQVAKKAEHGWDSPDMEVLKQRIAEQLHQPLEQVQPFLHHNAGEAAAITSGYGMKAAAQKIPLPAWQAKKFEEQAATHEEERAEASVVFLEPDPLLQLKILRELSALLNSRPNLNTLLEMVLEGIYRGVGMDRALFTLLTPDHRALRPRLALGAAQEKWVAQFHLDVDKAHPNLLTCTMDDKESLWVKDSRAPQYYSQLPAHFIDVLQVQAFFLSPIIINQRAIGLFYADREPSARPLDEESFESFKLFTQQANLGLQHLTAKPDSAPPQR
ncbi:MAG: HDOD domain-containing protein [Pseudomonadota bacterium]